MADAVLSARDLLRWQFTLVHHLLDMAITGLSAEAIRRCPPSTITPVAACFAQAVVCEDFSVNGVLAAGTPLALSSWAGRSGISELPPLAGSDDWRAWGRQVRLDLDQLLPYAHAVHAATDAYLADLPDDALDQADGATPACLLSALLLTLAMRRGEMARHLVGERCPATDQVEV
jgi:hypothetical protein